MWDRTVLSLISLLALGASVLPAAPAAPADPFVYDSAPLMLGKDIPGLELRSEDHAAYCGLRYGKGEKEILYLVFDCKAKYERHDVVHVYIPDHEVYGQPRVMKGREGDDHTAFRPVRVEGRFGDLTVQYEITLTATSLWEKPKVETGLMIGCRLVDEKKRVRCSFVLVGEMLVGMQGHIDIELAKLMQVPRIRARWDHRSNPPHIRSCIVMGKRALVPDSGWSSRATVLIREKEGRVREKRKIKIVAGANGDFKYKPQKRLRASTPYTAVVEVDMGRLFGVIRGEAVMVLR